MFPPAWAFTGALQGATGPSCSLPACHQGGPGLRAEGEQGNHFWVLRYPSTMARIDLEMGRVPVGREEPAASTRSLQPTPAAALELELISAAW